LGRHLVAATTVTTVGYGDLEVTTNGGRIVAMAIMLVGIGFVALTPSSPIDSFRAKGKPEPKRI
jgi:voltage-gated potassium channel Kch